MQFLHLAKDGLKRSNETFALRTPFPHFCSSGISSTSKVVEFKAFVSGSAFSGLQVKTSIYYVPGTVLDSWAIEGTTTEVYHQQAVFMILMRKVKTQIVLFA